MRVRGRVEDDEDDCRHERLVVASRINKFSQGRVSIPEVLREEHEDCVEDTAPDLVSWNVRSAASSKDSTTSPRKQRDLERAARLSIDAILTNGAKDRMGVSLVPLAPMGSAPRGLVVSPPVGPAGGPERPIARGDHRSQSRTTDGFHRGPPEQSDIPTQITERGEFLVLD